MAVLTGGSRRSRGGSWTCAAARRRVRVTALVLVCLGVAVAAAAAEAGRPRVAASEELTAAFVYNLAKFVEWPADVLPDDADELIIGVLGEESVAGALRRGVVGKTARGRRLSIVSFAKPSELAPVHLLFIGSAQAVRLEEIHSAIGEHGVFTVGDTPDFVRRGGMMGLLERENKLTFEVNIDAVRRAGLQISSKLLRLSAGVHGAP